MASDKRNSCAADFLKRLPIFTEIDDDELISSLAQHFKRSVHPKDDVLAKEGEPQRAMFLIESGKVKRVKGGVPVDELGEEDVSGMLHLFTQDPCFATLVCVEETAVWSLEAKQFHELLGVKDSSLAAKLLVIFSKQLRENSKLIRKQEDHSKYTITFFDFKPYEKEPFEKANKTEAKGELALNFCPERLSERTVHEAAGSDAICIFVNDRANAKVIAELASMKVKLIALRCAGYNNVDLAACQAHGIQVVRVPAYSPYAVAEHAMGLVLTLNRKLHKAYNRTREGNFALQGLLGFDIHGKTVGVVGTGKIGQCLIDILIGFGCTVLCYDVYQSDAVKQKHNTSYVPLDELLARSDIISLHLPLLDSTRHIVNEKSIAKMKRGVMLINTSRGGLIETSALISGLKSGHIGYAGLDVYEEEEAYFFEDHSAEVISDSVLARLFTFPNVVITGHQAFFTSDALDNIAQTTVKNVVLYREGKSGGDHPNNVKAEYS